MPALRDPLTGRMLPNGGADPDTKRRYAATPKGKRQKWAGHLRRYGLTTEEYEEMERRQGGVCSVCGGRDPSGQRLSVDHDHRCCPERARSCGQCVRGLVCTTCNVRLGVLENAEWCALAERYQKEWSWIS